MNSAWSSCLVLTTTDHGESDRLVTLYSEELGKVTGIAKGAKRSLKRFVNKLEPFSRIRLHYRPSRTSSLLFICGAELEQAFLSLRHSYPRYLGAIYLCELVLRFSKEKDPEQKLYCLLHWALAGLDSGERPLRVCALFHLRLLQTVGYQPELSHCSHCLLPVGPGHRYSLLAGNGTLLCNRCHQGRESFFARQISLQTLKFLNKAQQDSLEHLHRLQLPDNAARESLAALYHYSRYLLQQEIHSWKPLLNSTGRTSGLVQG
ncbi:DNA repair protein RecO [Desulfogranum mediterraneum]|uniref:DNA repair protein RecO n=1 Tax=Desulfogranum mediterraneum TaxID=160661 RepID=UPI00041E4B84|nr:DNA repair protein RecO [Desulfogranum mediterraneum]